MRKIMAVGIAAFGVSGCASVPADLNNLTRQSFDSSISYTQAFRVISKQFTACKRAVGVFGNGFDVQSDLDSDAKEGRIDYYYHGLTGVKDNNFAATQVVVTPLRDGGSRIVVTGTKPKYVYIDYMSAQKWLKGDLTCGM